MIATVALLVVGPDRLPAFAKQTGKWFGKLSRLINNLKTELKQELLIDEGKAFKQQLNELDDLMKNAPDQDPDFSNESNLADKSKAPSSQDDSKE